MKVYLVLFTCVCAAVTAYPESNYEVYDLEKAPELFEQFVKDNNKQYKDEADRQKRYEAFVINLKWINEMNAKSGSAVYGITMFSDKTEEEWKNPIHGKRPQE